MPESSKPSTDTQQFNQSAPTRRTKYSVKNKVTFHLDLVTDRSAANIDTEKAEYFLCAVIAGVDAALEAGRERSKARTEDAGHLDLARKWRPQDQEMVPKLSYVNQSVFLCLDQAFICI